MDVPYASDQDALRTDAFFAGYPQAASIWTDIARAAATWGDVRVVATKSRVALLARTRFAWCPQAHKAGTLFVRCILPAPIDSPRVRNDTMADGRISARFRMADADAEAMAWIRAAYRFDVG